MIHHESDADAGRVGMFTTTPDLVVTTWDRTLEAMVGIAADAIVGRRLHDVVPDLSARGLLEAIATPLQTGQPQVLAPALHRYLFPCPPLRRSCEFDRMQQRVVVAALREDDRVVGLLFSVEDVTARLERERELARELRDPDPAVRQRAIQLLTAAEPLGGLDLLTTALSDDDWRVRQDAVAALARKRDRAIVDAMIRALRERHEDFSVLSSAIQLLTTAGVDATEALAMLLGDRDPGVRMQAALVLGTQHNEAAVRALLSALDDPDPNVRFHAIEALGRIGAVEALEPLAAIAESDDFFLSFPAVDAVVHIDHPAVARRILPLLEKPALVLAVAEALARIGDARAVVPLVRALDRPDAPVTPVVLALDAIHARYDEWLDGGTTIEDAVREAITPAATARILDALPRLAGSDLQSLVTVISWLDDDVVRRALAPLATHPGIHAGIVDALARFGASAVDLLVAQLDREDLAVRRAAVVALGRIGHRGAVPALLRVLGEGKPELSATAAAALARIGDPRAFEPLLARLGDPDVAVRLAAIGALNSIGHPDAAARICQLLESSDPLVRESAVKIAGYFGYAECVDAVLAQCRDPHEAVRSAALEQLPYAADDRALAELERALADDTPRARAAAARALGRIDDPRASALLVRAIDDPDAWVRRFAALGLGERRDTTAVALLQRVAETDPVPPVRAAAIDALGAIVPRQCFPMIDRFAAEDNVDVAAVALRILGAGHDGRVADGVRLALHSPEAARRRAAAEALGGALGTPEAVELLRVAASDEDGDVSKSALSSLSRLAATDDPIGSHAARTLVRLAVNPQLHASALALLARLPSSAMGHVGELLDADEPATRRAAVDALGMSRQPGASAQLQRALDNADPDVRERAVVALSRLGTRAADARLSALARTDPAAGVRAAAAAALERGDASAPGGRS